MGEGSAGKLQNSSNFCHIVLKDEWGLTKQRGEQSLQIRDNGNSDGLEEA